MSDLGFEECGETFVGYLRPGDINGMDFSVPRWCSLPMDHLSNHGYLSDYYPPRPRRLTVSQGRILRVRRDAK